MMRKCLIIVFFILITAFIFIAPSVFAITSIDLFRITSSGQREDWAVIDKDTILWMDPRDDGTVYAYNAKEKREYPFFPNGLPIPNLFGLVEYDGRYLAYNRITDQNSYDVGIYDTRRKQDISITNEPGSQTATDFDQGTVVYIDGNACGKLYAYDMRRKRKTLITQTACGSVRISRSTVVWGYAAPGGTDIYGYDLRRNKQFTITNADGIQDSPDIEGNDVIWVSNDIDGQSIHLKNIRTGVEKVLLQTSSYGVSWPAISKDYAIWAKIVQPHVTGVEGINLTTGEIFEVQAPGPQQNSNLSSVIEGDLAAWMSWRTGNGDIYGAYINQVNATPSPTPNLSPSPLPPAALHDTFDGPNLDTVIWEHFSTNSGSYSFDNGFIVIPGGTSMSYIRSKNSPFPTTGPFTAEFGIQYTSVDESGVGVALGFEQQNGYDPSNVPVAYWQGSNFGLQAVRFGLTEAVMGSNPDLSYHIGKIVYDGDKYHVYLDGILKYTSPSSLTAKSLWFGNPFCCRTNWTGFKLDYIKVTQP